MFLLDCLLAGPFFIWQSYYADSPQAYLLTNKGRNSVSAFVGFARIIVPVAVLLCWLRVLDPWVTLTKKSVAN
jgi:hypothetical protein